MTISESFYTWLTADASVAALVGDRIYPQIIDPNEPTRPAITWEQALGEDIGILDGGQSDTRFAEFRVNCWAFTVKEAHDLADTLRTAWLAIDGTIGALQADRVSVEMIDDGPVDMTEPNRPLYRVILRLRIAYG